MIRNSRIAAALLLAVSATACRGAAPVPGGFQGIVELDQRVLAFEVPGRVDRVAVQRGDLVQTGQPLVQLDDTLERLTVESRREDVAAAQADLVLLEAGTRREDVAAVADDLKGAIANEDELRKTADRVRALVAQGALPNAELDRADADLQRAEAQRKSTEQRLSALRRGARPEEIARTRARVDQAKSVLALEEERLARYTLHANADGEVIDIEVKPGELAAVGTAAVTLADAQHPYVDVFVPQGQLAGVRPGAHAHVRVDATNAPFDGAVEFVSPETEFTPKFLFSERERPNLVVRVRVRLQDPDRRLHAGVPAFASIEGT
jgi:HlyD family secretion protein